MSDIPVYVVAFNQATYVRDMVSQLRRLTKRIVIVDNASTYEPLLRYYDSLRDGDGDDDAVVTCVRHTTNRGHRVVHTHMLEDVPDVFAVTDPDLLLPPTMPDDALDRMAQLSEQHRIGKVGVALDISPSMAFKEHLRFGDSGLGIREFERRFWLDRVPHDTLEVYRAQIDTTLAVCNKRYMRTFGDALRVAGDYTTVHRPWLQDDGLSDDERDYYMDHKRSDVGVWLRRRT